MSTLKIKVSVPFEMEYEEMDGFVGWSTTFPGAVVQAESLDQLIEEFKTSIEVISQYLYDQNEK